jgi:hypothetical protein
MAVKFLESFDKYAAGAGTPAGNTGWNNFYFASVQAASASSRNGDTTAGLGQYLSGGNAIWTAPFVTTDANDATWVVGFARYEALPASAVTLLWLYGDNNSVIHVELVLNANGSITVKRGANGTVLTTSAPAWIGSAWNFMEVKATLHDSTGAVIVKLNGVEIINISGVDTRNGGTNAHFDAVTFPSVTRLDDIYLVNQEAGGSTDFLGDLRVEAHIANGQGNSNQWLHAAGGAGDSTSYQEVDERPGADDDTSYVKSSTLNDKDTYAFENTFATSGGVKAVQVTARARKDDAVAKAIQLVVRASGGTEALSGTDLALSTTYAYLSHVFQDEPGGSGWTRSAFDGAQAGMKLTAAS